jgi:hypothetical protein
MKQVIVITGASICGLKCSGASGSRICCTR